MRSPRQAWPSTSRLASAMRVGSVPRAESGRTEAMLTLIRRSSSGFSFQSRTTVPVQPR